MSPDNANENGSIIRSLILTVTLYSRHRLIRRPQNTDFIRIIRYNELRVDFNILSQ